LWATTLKNLQQYYVHTANHINCHTAAFWNLSLDVAEMGKKVFGLFDIGSFWKFLSKKYLKQISILGPKDYKITKIEDT